MILSSPQSLERETARVEHVARCQGRRYAADRCRPAQVVMLWQKGANPAEHWDPGIAATIRLFPSEEAMLAAWLALLHDADPDGLVTFQVGHLPPSPQAASPVRLPQLGFSSMMAQARARSRQGMVQLSQSSGVDKHGCALLSRMLWQVKDTLGALAERFKALRLEGGGLHISRAAPGRSHALALKRVVQYNPNWVKNQQVRPRQPPAA